MDSSVPTLTTAEKFSLRYQDLVTNFERAQAAAEDRGEPGCQCSVCQTIRRQVETGIWE